MDSSFIFNGFPFPNFTNRWNLVWNEEAHEVSLPLPVVGVHDIASIICSLDHEGMVESEDFEVFIYAVQEILSVASVKVREDGDHRQVDWGHEIDNGHG